MSANSSYVTPTKIWSRKQLSDLWTPIYLREKSWIKLGVWSQNSLDDFSFLTAFGGKSVKEHHLEISHLRAVDSISSGHTQASEALITKAHLAWNRDVKREGARVLDGLHILCFPHSFLVDYSVLTQEGLRIQWLTAQMLELEGFDSESQLCNVLAIWLCIHFP